MNRTTVLLALGLLGLPIALAAESWQKIDELPGGIALEVDRDTQVEALDGIALVQRATFRRQLPTGTIETAVAIDCQHKSAKIRGVRLKNGDAVISETVTNYDDFTPINPGSSEALYFKALCYEEIPLPPPTEEEVQDFPPPEEVATEPEEPEVEGDADE